MANQRDISSRIKSVKKTAQITRAMQLVAASKMKHAQDKALQVRPYGKILSEMIAMLGSRMPAFQHRFLAERPQKHRGIALITTDKGLCGGLNANLAQQIAQIESSAKFISIGRKGTNYLVRNQRPLIAKFSISDHVLFSEVRPVLEFSIQAFEDGTIDTLEVAYAQFVNTLVQKPTLVPLLPISSLQAFLEAAAREQEEPPPIRDPREMFFEPSTEQVLNALLPLYIRKRLFQLILEAKASEHSARMVAMKAATDNARELTDILSLQYNKIRQAMITQEILEIGAASQAMTG